MSNKKRAWFWMGLGGAITAVLVIMVGMGLRWSLRNNQLSNYYAPITSAVLGMPWERDHPWGAQPPYALTESDQKILDDARQRIEDRRDQRRIVELRDAEGQPVPAGTKVAYKLHKPAFGFGNFDEASPQMDTLWGPLKTEAYGITTWNDMYLDDQDTYDFRKAEVFLPTEWRNAVGLETVWHNVVWLLDKRDETGKGELRLPVDFPKYTREQQREIILDWTRRAAEYTDGKFDIVNVYNEPLNEWTDPYHWGKEARRELLADVIRTFRKHNQTSEIQISIGEALTAFEGNDAEWLLSWLRANDLPVDRVAIQLWSNGYFNWGEEMPTLTLTEAYEALSELTDYGFALDFSEFMAPRTGSQHRYWEWNPQRQADWTEIMMTLAFSLPNVKSFSYFRSHDNFMHHGGVFEGTEELPVAERIRQTLRDWRSQGEAVVSADGRVEIRGFPGQYLLEAPEAQTYAGMRWAVEVQDGPHEQEPVAATFESIPTPAPASIVNMGPEVTADHYLDVQFELLGRDSPTAGLAEAGAINLMDRIMPLSYHPRKAEVRGLAESNGTYELGGSYIAGFSIDELPEDAQQLRLVLDIPDRGTSLQLNLFDRTRRYSDAELKPGRYLVTVPLREGSRPALHLTTAEGKRKFYPKDDQGERPPYGILLDAWVTQGQGDNDN